jgi:hypothetical protein
MSPSLLPGCDEVFARYFAPWYQEPDWVARPFSATRPDVEGWAEPNTHPDAASRLGDEGRQTALRQIAGMVEAARGDWPGYLPVVGGPSHAWIEAFDEYWTAERVHELFGRSNPSDFGNDLVVTACEFGAVLGYVMREAVPQLEWLPDWPYWESGLLDVPSGYRINVFHWAIKRFSEYGLEDGYGAKVAKCLELVRNGWDA